MRKNQNRKLFFCKFAVLNNNDENTLYYREDENTLQRMRIVRKYLSEMNVVEAMEFIHDRVKKTTDNNEFLMTMNE